MSVGLLLLLSTLLAAPPAAAHPPVVHPASARAAKKPAKPGKGKPGHPAERTATPLPFLPHIQRVRIEVGKDGVLQVIDINLPRDEYRGGSRKLWVSFGAPGVPTAVDAHLAPGRTALTGATAPSAIETFDANWNSDGDEIPFEFSPVRPRSANAILGPDHTAGLSFDLSEAHLKAAFANADVATLRVRALLTPNEGDGSGKVGVVVRMGTETDAYTLAAVEIAGRNGVKIASGEANFCAFPSPSREASGEASGDSRRIVPALVPLAIATIAPKHAAEAQARVAPALAQRHPFDALCLRYAVE